MNLHSERNLVHVLTLAEVVVLDPIWGEINERVLY
jgi:hypothetical protein